jgi:SAM-dependent methyltransferase
MVQIQYLKVGPRGGMLGTDHSRPKELRMTQTPVAASPDLGAIKSRQQQTWASGDYAAVAARIVVVAERLCDAADLQAGWHVLDVATGTGNAAIAAARHGCSVIGADYVPALLERGRKRAATEGLDVRFIEADAEALPFADKAFDAATSVFGTMFAPDHARTAAELLRVVRPGGTIALASWTPDGFVGELFRTVARHVPPPTGLASPMLWGIEAHLRDIFGEGISTLTCRERTFTFRFGSPEEFAEFFRLAYGPTLKAFAALEGSARAALEHDLVELARRSNRLENGVVAIPATYLQAIAVTRAS